MFGRNNNNMPGNSVNVNTKIYSSFAEDSLLIMTAWNSNISIKFQPAIGKNQDGLTQYSSEMSEQITSTISSESAELMLKGIEEEILPAIKDKKDASIGTLVGANASTRKLLNITTDGTKVVLSVIFGGQGVNLDGTSSGTSILHHTFNNRNYIKNYQKDVGGESVSVPSDFYTFVTKLKDITNVDGSIAHGIKYQNAITAAFTANKYQQHPENNTPQNTYQAPITNAGSTDIDEFLPFN